MAVPFTKLAQAVHARYKAASVGWQAAPPLSLSHVREALAAGFGYGTFASLTAAIKSGDEAQELNTARHLMLDRPRMSARLQELGHKTVAERLVESLREGLHAALPAARLHEDIDDLCESISGELEEAIRESGSYLASEAEMSATGGDFHFDEFNQAEPIDTATGVWQLHVVGTSSLDQDPDRVFHGDKIDVDATALFPKLGRRLLGAMEIVNPGGSEAEHPTDDDQR